MRLCYEILMLKGILIIIPEIIWLFPAKLGFQFPSKQILPLVLIVIGLVETYIGYFGRRRYKD